MARGAKLAGAPKWCDEFFCGNVGCRGQCGSQILKRVSGEGLWFEGHELFFWMVCGW